MKAAARVPSWPSRLRTVTDIAPPPPTAGVVHVSEVALTQFAFPDSIKQATLDPPRAPSGRFHGPADYRRRFPDGRIGSNPGMATPEKGKRFYEAAVPELAKTYAGFIGENA